MYVFYACSNRYAPFLGVSIESLFENNRCLKTLDVFVCNDSISSDNLDKLRLLAKKYSRNISFLDYSVLEKTAKELNWKSQGGSFSTYSKLLVDQYMPSYVDRVLYIDSSDTYIADSIEALETLEMGDCAFAARVAVSFHASGNSMPTYDFAIAKEKTYYNCGVFLIDMANWRKRRCFEIVKEQSLSNPHFDIFDQTIINAYLPSDYGMKLPLEYNYNGYVYAKGIEKKKLSIGGFYTEEEIERASKRPIIIHWPGGIHHPYVQGGLCRRKEVYMDCLNKSLWKNDVDIIPVSKYLQSSKGFAYKYFPLIEFYLPRTSALLYKLVSFVRKHVRRHG